MKLLTYNINNDDCSDHGSNGLDIDKPSWWKLSTVVYVAAPDSWIEKDLKWFLHDLIVDGVLNWDA